MYTNRVPDLLGRNSFTFSWMGKWGGGLTQLFGASTFYIKYLKLYIVVAVYLFEKSSTGGRASVQKHSIRNNIAGIGVSMRRPPTAVTLYERERWCT